ncbi:hypothetical protein [Actinomadura sp. DC4]|uniref:hypothetical protein n=1 Tax=Actinomadura sp. DC4 TaxID=3055069 RepID=UPI0025B1964A|nr:hypothetical protein [Actinomadura sp. DC4]MDN3355816.1 hypothetical protein [Actinomadura sp. DC4]
MATGVYIDVPQDLADLLAEDGFRRAGVKRGVEVVDAVQIGVGLGANLVTILLAKYQIPQFVKHWWNFARGGGPAERRSVKITFEADGEPAALTFEHEHDGPPPEVVVRAMIACLESLIRPPESGPE